MTFHDADDNALVQRLRANVEELTAELAAWRKRAEEALALARQSAAMADESVMKLGIAEKRVADLEAELEQLRCGDLVQFSDGELEPARADKFRAHLDRCEDCRTGLVANRELDARLSRAAEARNSRERGKR